MIKGNESLVENFNFYFLPPLYHTFKMLKCFILLQTPLQLDNWLQSYDEFVNAKNNIKQRNLNTVFANISKTTSPTSDSFLLIMSHIKQKIWDSVFANISKAIYATSDSFPLIMHVTYMK